MSHHQQHTKMIETCHISPPNGTVPTTKLPLTVFDIMWLDLPAPLEILLFYSYPIQTDLFLKEYLPSLKQSLSTTLQHFFPYASSLIIPPYPGLPYLSYIDGKQDSSLPFTVAESIRQDFDYLKTDLPKDEKLLDDLIPKLSPPHVSPEGFQILPTMTIQLTVFPGYGVSLGCTFTHVVGDGISFSNFMNYWCRSNGGGDPKTIHLHPQPNHSFRNAIRDPGGVAMGFLDQFWSQKNSVNQNRAPPKAMVRATFTMKRNQIDGIRRWIAEQTSPVSCFVVTLAIAWVSFIKTLTMDDKTDQESFHLVFYVDSRSREGSLSSTYVGNCTSPCYVSLKKQDLVGENGVLAASSAIKACVKEMISSKDIVKTAATWRQRLHECIATRHPVMVTGSPRLGAYDWDYGMGKPSKLELLHVRSTGLISLSEARDGSNGVELGLALEQTQMKAFASTLQHELKVPMPSPFFYPKL